MFVKYIMYSEKFSRTKISTTGRYSYTTSSIERYVILHRDSRFKKSDAFIGFQKDTPASVVFQASNMLKAACAGLRGTMEGIEERWENVMQWSGLTVDDMYMEEEGELRDWIEAVSRKLMMH